MTDTVQTQAQAVHGDEIVVPLNKLKKSPRNVRKVPHTDAEIEALAATIQAAGRVLQNLTVEPEVKDGEPTGFYLVTAGEGRRLAQVLRAKRKQIKKTEPIRCVLDTENDPAEISLIENATQTAMHPADQFDAFRDLADRKGWGAEAIGARHGVTAQVVKQRLRLGAVSPKLMQVYREGGLNLDQMMAFAVSEDHARQEQVYAGLSWNKEPRLIRRDMTEGKVPATDRRAVFVGPKAYEQAAGVILRDLFTEDRGGYFEDAALLDRLVLEKLNTVAAEVQAEGWKWTEAHVDFPHAHGLARHYTQDVALSPEDEARLETVQAEYDAAAEACQGEDDLTEAQAQTLDALEAELEALVAKQGAYDPEVIARGGVFVTLTHDGQARIERGFVRPEDEPMDPMEAEEDAEQAAAEDEEGEPAEPEAGSQDEEERDDGKPIPDSLIRDLTAHRTLGLRLALGEQPDLALVVLTHALAVQVFFPDSEATCLEITAESDGLGGHAEGIMDTQAGEAMAIRHDHWAGQLPRNAADLWPFVVALDGDSRSLLLAHCVALAVNAVRVPWERRTQALAAADDLASALALDMTAHWRPTVRSYFGRVTKAHIAEAVAEAQSPEAADRIRPMKKADMAQAAEQLVAATGWLPALLRTRPQAETGEGIDPPAEAAPEAGDAYPVAAE
jgi:ParB family chromosome partitioning protein